MIVEVALDVVAFAVGAAIVIVTLLSAVRTVVIPHGDSVRLTAWVFRSVRSVASSYRRIDRSPQRQHNALQVALAAGLLLLPIVWLSSVVVGYTLMFRACGTDSWRDAYEMSGSSVFTLGFARPDDLPRMTLAFTASALAIAILALLLVTYLPTIYNAYTRRETRLTDFETFAGDPPNVVAMVIRSNALSNLQRIDELWDGWQLWFAELCESHTTLPAVAFLGSSREDRNWVATVGTLLDAAAVSLPVLDIPHNPAAALCIRSGSLALRDIAEYFGVEVDHDPDPDDPISVPREQWDRADDDLVDGGVPVVERDEAWRNWAGWRVNYDAALVGLGELTVSPTTRLATGGTYGGGGISE